MSHSIQTTENLSTLTADPSLLKIVKELLPNFPDRQIPIAREAQRLKERLSSTPFYARRAEKEGDYFWVSWSLSYRGTD
jgi:hypothetical protein